jgi:hypothetical protein
LQPERDAKAELNHRNQVCEFLTDTGIRVAKNGARLWLQTQPQKVKYLKGS